MSDVGQRLAEMLHARAEQTKVTIDLDDVKRAGSVDHDVPERRGQPSNRQGGAGEVAEFGALEHPDDYPVRDRPRRRRMQVAAAAIVVLGLGLLALGVIRDPDSVQTDTVTPTPTPAPSTTPTASLRPADSSPATLPATTTPATTPTVSGEEISEFAAAIEGSGVLSGPSADEQAQATDYDLYRDGNAQTQVSAAGNSVSLRRCRDSASATCGNGWAYVTGVADGGEVHGGLLGEASPVNLRLQPLDDRYFVASESSPDAQTPTKAWLIDAVSGRAGPLSWRDEPTTLNSPEQTLLLCQETDSSFGGIGCDDVRGPDTPEGEYQFVPTEGGLPRVVDARDGTIRPFAMPESVVTDRPVWQHGTGRIWVVSNPVGDRLGLAYSADGGATWNEVALPAQVHATSEESTTSLLAKGNEVLEIAADGDRVAVVDKWGPPGDDNTVYVSDNAGVSWTAATSEPDGNGVHLYVLADGRLVVMGSTDAHPGDLLVSTGSDWADLEFVDVDFDPESPSDQERRFYVNGTGVAMIPLYVYPCDGAHPCPGYTEAERQRYLLDSVDFSTDLMNWSTIKIPEP